MATLTLQREPELLRLDPATGRFTKRRYEVEVASGPAAGTRVTLGARLVIGSQVVSNVPLILLLAPWIRGLDDPRLAWTLTALASTLAGNLTLLGSVANVIVIERSGERLGFFAYLRVGVPVTLVSTAVAVAVAVAMRS